MSNKHWLFQTNNLSLNKHTFVGYKWGFADHVTEM